MDFGRPTSSGSTVAGNSTALRIGRIGMVPSGRAASAPGTPAFGCGRAGSGRSGVPSRNSVVPLLMGLVLRSDKLAQHEPQAAFAQRALGEFISSGRQADSPLETPMRQFHAPDDGRNRN